MPNQILSTRGSRYRGAEYVAESVYETASIFDAEPQKYCVQMGFDCAFVHLELARNCFIWMPSADKRYDLSLAIRQITRTLNSLLPLRLRSTEAIFDVASKRGEGTSNRQSSTT